MQRTQVAIATAAVASAVAVTVLYGLTSLGVGDSIQKRLAGGDRNQKSVIEWLNERRPSPSWRIEVEWGEVEKRETETKLFLRVRSWDNSAPKEIAYRQKASPVAGWVIVQRGEVVRHLLDSGVPFYRADGSVDYPR